MNEAGDANDRDSRWSGLNGRNSERSGLNDRNSGRSGFNDRNSFERLEGKGRGLCGWVGGDKFLLVKKRN